MTVRRRFWLTVAAVIMLAFFAVGGSLPGRVGRTEPQPEASVGEKTLYRGNEQIVLDVRVPVVSGLGDRKLEHILNSRVRAQVDAARAAAETEAAALWREAEQEGFLPWLYVFHADYEVYSARGVLSMRVTAALDNGGVGLPHTVYYNVDIARHSWLTLDDLFASEAYKEVIGTYIRDQISADERFLPEEFVGMSQKTSFFIRDGRLHIAFAKYEISDGMTGEPVFGIPPKLLRGLVKPEYAGLLL